jgi:hypothetical protein
VCAGIDAAAADRPRIEMDRLSDVPACDTGALRAPADAARQAAIQPCEFVLAVERRSALDRLISGTGVRHARRLSDTENVKRRRAAPRCDAARGGLVRARGEGVCGTRS